MSNDGKKTVLVKPRVGSTRRMEAEGRNKLRRPAIYGAKLYRTFLQVMPAKACQEQADEINQHPTDHQN